MHVCVRSGTRTRTDPIACVGSSGELSIELIPGGSEEALKATDRQFTCSNTVNKRASEIFNIVFEGLSNKFSNNSRVNVSAYMVNGSRPTPWRHTRWARESGACRPQPTNLHALCINHILVLLVCVCMCVVIHCQIPTVLLFLCVYSECRNWILGCNQSCSERITTMFPHYGAHRSLLCVWLRLTLVAAAVLLGAGRQAKWHGCFHGKCSIVNSLIYVWSSSERQNTQAACSCVNSTKNVRNSHWATREMWRISPFCCSIWSIID